MPRPLIVLDLGIMSTIKTTKFATAPEYSRTLGAYLRLYEFQTSLRNGYDSSESLIVLHC